ncbi:MAG: preprotein translocase subunit YajC [Gracilimonas sp.]|uniref:preprotein translocase subunit YajC n=1 Tax=Gracilimonas TaxID=649462 RepID=UPI001AFE4A1A|nr:preprotein translocase subunit YajC [Gracilimonas sp.]MBO6585025.1 preprotein translocase subunit YajC [Gracilimonas sp.]MBO6615704.1 preprotein translocase subunit YajC [Gracilimonas sp.]
MHFLPLFLMGNPDDPNAGIINLVFLGAIFLVFYLFIIRPQSKRQKEIKEQVEGMKKGDKVVTSSGIIGIVDKIEENEFLLDIDSGTKLRMLKSAVTDVNPHKQDKD